jgi:hypothetical protein
MAPLPRRIRGIRDSLPSGYIVGRVSSQDGPAELISLRDLTIAQQSVMPSRQLSPITGTNSDFGFFFQGKPAFSNMILATIKFTKAMRLPASLVGSEFVADSPPVADYTVTLLQNGSSIGTITFAASTGIPSVSVALASTFSIGDTFSIQGPVAPDAGIQDISFNFAGLFI